MPPIIEGQINGHFLKDSFPIFRIACNSVAQNPSLQSIKDLRLKLQEFSSVEYQNEKPLTPLLDYIAFPLLLILEKPHMSWNIQEESLLCLLELLEKARCCSPESFQRIFSSCFLILADRKNPSTVSPCSEELKLTALEAVLCLLCGCPSELLLRLLNIKQTRLQLGHAIFICLKIAQHETNRQLRIQALEVVCKLGLEGVWDNSEALKHNTPSSLFVEEGVRHQDDHRRLPIEDLSQTQTDQAREALGGFLPGVCFAATKLALGDDKQGHRLTVTSLRTLSHFLTATLDDEFLSRQGALPTLAGGGRDWVLAKLQKYMLARGGPKEQEQPAKEESPASCDSLITATWLEETGEKVCQLVAAVCGQLVSHAHPAVRKQLALAVGEIVRHCHRSMPGLVVPCVEALATLAVDPSTAVRAAARHTVCSAAAAGTELPEDSCKPSVTDRNCITVNGDAPPGKLRDSDSNVNCGSDRNNIAANCKVSSEKLFEVHNEEGHRGCLAKQISSTNHLEGKQLVGTGNVMNSPIKNLQQEHANNSHTDPQRHEVAPRVVTRCEKINVTDFNGAKGPELGEVCWGSRGELPASVQDTLQERLCQAIKQLPTLAMASECRLLAQARQLRGCLLLLGYSRREQLLALPGICCSLMLAVAASTAYDAGDPDLLLEGTVLLEPCSFSLFPPHGGGRRLHLSSFAVTECWRMCRTAGGVVSAPQLLQAWADALHGNGHLRAELLDVLTALLEGFTLQNDEELVSADQSHSDDELEHLVSSILDIILTDKMLLVPIDGLEDGTAKDDALENATKLEEPCGGQSPKQASVADTLEHIYTEFNSPFNPCLTSSGFPSSSSSARRQPPSSRDVTSPGDTTGNLTSSSRRRKQRVLVTAASLRAVAACARLLSTSFVPFLWRVMCPLLEKCGDRNLLVSEEARRALDVVGLSCGYRGGLRELVEEAIPHYWYPLSIQLRRPQQYPKAPQILQVALRCSSAGGSSRLSDFLQQVLQELLQCLDSHHSLAPQQLLALLRLYLASNTPHGPTKETNGQSNTAQKEAFIGNTTPVCQEESQRIKSDLDCTGDVSSKFTDTPTLSGLGPLALFLHNHHENHLHMRAAFESKESDVQRTMEKKLSDLGVDEESKGVGGFKDHLKEALTKEPFAEISDDIPTCDENKDDNESNYNDTAKADCVADSKAAQDAPPLEDYKEDTSSVEKEVPADVQLIVSILERCCFLLHTRDRDTALVLLDTIELGCGGLRAWEDSQLPVLHKVWKPLMLRIRSPDSVVSLRALTVCCVMVASSGDFLRKRCLKELLPRINAFLISQSAASLGKTARCGYLLTTTYEAQRRLLEALYPRLMEGLRLGAGEMIEAVRCCAAYLDNRQPGALVQASISMLRQVAESHPQQVWLAMGRLLPPVTLHTTYPHGAAIGLASIRLDGGSRDRSHLPSTVLQLFKELS